MLRRYALNFDLSCSHAAVPSDNGFVTTATDSPPDIATRFARNTAALDLDWPMPINLIACLARDGSTTATRDGEWLAGCSVPRRAAELMIRHEKWTGRTLCLLTPTHGQQIAAVLAKLPVTSALIAVFTSPAELADALACCDFDDDVRAGRLHVAWDEPTLADLFDRSPGLATPRQIVRLPDADPAAVAAAMPWTQGVFGRIALEQAQRITAAATVNRGTGVAPVSLIAPTRAGRTCAASSSSPAPRCLLVGRQFKLWHDAGDTLARVLHHTIHSTEIVDTDRPTAAAEALQAERSAAAATTIADRPRPAWATWQRPWTAWLTTGDTPAFQTCFAADCLLLPSAAAITAALAAGWPADRVSLAAWPALQLPHTPGAPLTLLYDLPDLSPPADIAEFSSRQLVWEAIHEELTANPFAVGDDAAAYVRRAPSRLNLPLSDDFPAQRFVDALVRPAFVVGVATWLAARGVAFTLHGRGWDAFERLAGYIRGPIADRPAFETVIATSGGVVDPFFAAEGPVQSLGVPTLRCFARTPPRVLQDVDAIRSGRWPKLVVRSPLHVALFEAAPKAA